MEVKFFVFTKKYNSTLRPTLSDGVSYECVLKSSSSVIAPTLELNYGLLVNPSQYNYCYIEAYGRYYWVQEWTFTQSYWIASLSVDVLATWRPYIGSEDMYVYRSSAEYDGNLKDTTYTTTSNTTRYRLDLNAIEVSGVMSAGYYIVSILGGTTDNGNTSNVRYYAFDSTNFGLFMNRLYSTIADDGIWKTVAVGVRNAIFDISSYVKTCQWSPMDPRNINALHTSIQIGHISLSGFNAYELTDAQDGTFAVIGVPFAIPKHPQASQRGNYCNLKPFTSYKLIYLPFGVIELDPTELVNFDYLSLKVGLDPITGEGILRIFAFNGTVDHETDITEIAVRCSKFLVDIPITFSRSNLGSSLQHLTFGTVGLAYTNNSIANSLVVIHGVQAVADNYLPTTSTVGNLGSLAELCYKNNCFQALFFEIAEDDPSSNGRPLCKVRKPQNIAGYIEGESNNFSAPATESEMVEVKRFIEQGFYYE